MQFESVYPRVPLGQLVDFINGDRSSNYPGPRDYQTNGVPFISATDIVDGCVHLDKAKRISRAAFARLRAGKVRRGDILLCIRGSLGKLGVVKDFDEGAIASSLVILRTADSAILRYLKHVLSGTAGASLLAGLDNGSVQGNISVASLGEMAVPLPPSCTVAAIGTFAANLDDRIEKLRQTNATLEAIAQTLFKSWFIDFDPVRAKAEGREPEGMDAATAALFPAEFEDSPLGIVPSGWTAACIGDIAEVIDCLHSKKPELTEGGNPFLQLSNIRDDGLLDTSEIASISETDYAKWTSRIEVREGDCVITNVGRVGAVAQVPAGFRAAMGRNMTAIRPRDCCPYPTFVIQLLLSSWMRAEIELKTDAGTILNALNVRSIPRLQFVRAPDRVLRAAEALLRPFRESMECNLARAAQLSQLRDALLPRLISGKLRLPEAQAQVEEALA